MESNKDLDHLRLLSIFHYIVGGLGFLFWLFPLFNVGMGYIFLQHPEILGNNQEASAIIGYFSLWSGIILFFFGQILSILILISGKCLKHRSKYNYSFAAACIGCLWIPIGTVLGVFTIMVLSRPSVKKLYGR